MSDTETVDTESVDTADTSTALDTADHAGETKPEQKTETKTEPYWKEDWRQQIAKDDEKYLKQLSRYASPEALADALRNAQKRISSGELKSALPKDATPEDIKAWREENGIPESADKYEIEGLDLAKLPESDQERYKAFLETSHAANLKPDQVKALLEFQSKYETERQAAEYEKDTQDKAAVMDKLNVEWGKGYRANINAVSGLLSTFPESVREAVKGARLPDGTLLFNNADAMRGFVAVALKDNPAAIIAPSGNGNPLQNIDSRIGEIEKLMRTNRKEYNRDEKVQAEYRELLDAKDKLSKRAA